MKAKHKKTIKRLYANYGIDVDQIDDIEYNVVIDFAESQHKEVYDLAKKHKDDYDDLLVRLDEEKLSEYSRGKADAEDELQSQLEGANKLNSEKLKQIFDRHCRDKGITYTKDHLSCLEMAFEDLTQTNQDETD